MELTGKQVESLQALFKAKTGLDISQEEATECGFQLVSLVKAVYRPIAKPGELQPEESINI